MGNIQKNEVGTRNKEKTREIERFSYIEILVRHIFNGTYFLVQNLYYFLNQC